MTYNRFIAIIMHISVCALTRKIISEYDNNYGSCGLDEAFADLTNHLEKRTVLIDEQRTFPQDVIR
jgi:hypothetical protein